MDSGIGGGEGAGWQRLEREKLHQGGENLGDQPKSHGLRPSKEEHPPHLHRVEALTLPGPLSSFVHTHVERENAADSVPVRGTHLTPVTSSMPQEKQTKENYAIGLSNTKANISSSWLCQSQCSGSSVKSL